MRNHIRTRARFASRHSVGRAGASQSMSMTVCVVASWRETVTAMKENRPASFTALSSLNNFKEIGL